MKHPFKLLVVDIDGTLVGKDGSIPPEAAKALAAVRALGLRFSLCTGRSILASRSVINRLAVDGFHIFFDGAYVGSPDTRTEVYSRPLPPPIVRQVAEYTREHGLNLEMSAIDKFYAARESRGTEIRRQFFGIEPVITDLTALWDKVKVIKANLLTTNAGEVAKAEALMQHFKDAVDFSHGGTPAYPGVDFLNILARGVSKGEALAALVAHLSIKLDEVIAIGDGSNDIPLFNAAGLAIAMGNAPDAVKATAHHVTADIEQNGLAQAIEQFLL